MKGMGCLKHHPSPTVTRFFPNGKLVSIGIGIPSTDYKVVDLANGKDEVPLGELGELIVKGPTGYDRLLAYA